MKDFADVIVYVAIIAIIIVASAYFYQLVWESDMPMWLKWMLLK
jgi:ABC-type multidrug transport system permease subunit